MSTVVLVDSSNRKLDNSHPFDVREIHEGLGPKVRKLFDEGNFAEATFHATKVYDKLVQRLSKLEKSGFKLMMDAFNPDRPSIRLNDIVSDSDRDEQTGYRYISSGVMSAIRNPRGHEVDILGDAEICLDHLSMVSHLVRRIEAAGYDV